MNSMPERKESKVTVFAGKGGVGKTTCAAAAALHFSLLGLKTLAISTDATPSLAHIFEIKAQGKPACVSDNLYFSELGTEEVTQMWDGKFGKDVYQVFASFVDIGYAEFADFIASMLPGLAEEFMVDYIRELQESGSYDRIIWDTAPLGQTLTLLETPALVSQHLRLAPRIYTKMKAGTGTKEPILDIIRRWEALSATDMEFLRRGVDFTIIAIAEALAVNQLDGTLGEMQRYGFKVSRLVINNVVKTADSPFLRQRAAQQQGYLSTIHGKYGHLQVTELPMFPQEVRGIEKIRAMAMELFG
ncbi:MAG: ArsA family ATPase [Dehalococcoidia bacterium]|nr:ArsA family ATPase [Dehalococcoidia bacterium]